MCNRRVLTLVVCVSLSVVALAALLVLMGDPTRAAGPWYVAPSGDDGNDCLSPATPCASINGAIGKASSGDTIFVAIGTYTGTGDEVVLVDRNVTLSGGWDASFTTQSGTSTVDGDGMRRGITVNTGVTITVELFRVRNGSAQWGGGIVNGGTLTLNGSTVSGNTASVSGGGINSYGTLTLNNSTVSGNTAAYSGGIRNDGTLTLNNSTISGNTANYDGGGIYTGDYGTTLTLNNSTVTGNTASGTYGNLGGGIRNYRGSVTLQNSILAGNIGGEAPDCHTTYGTIGSSGYNLIADVSGCAFSSSTGDLTNIDAKLGLLQDNDGSAETHTLLRGSPAIDAGDDSACPATDQRGVSRPQGGQCDIGAVEMQELELSTKTVNPSAGSHGTPLTFTITLISTSGAEVGNAVVTDPLPISLTYIESSVTATSGSYGYNTGVVTWTGSVSAGAVVTISFGAMVTETAPLGVYITNSAIISGGGEIITRTAIIYVDYRVYLPLVMR